MAKHAQAVPPEEERRGFFSKLAAVLIGGLVAMVPIGAGMATLLDPLFRKARKGQFLKVAKLNAVPDDGIPRRFPIIADQRDAWNYYPNQPVGVVYVRRLPDEKEVTVFSAVCPHVGCLVDYNKLAGESGLFQCPCHRSDFEPDGSRINPESCPSPRDLDTLEVDPERLALGEIWIDFKNFKTGHPEKEPIE